MLLRLDSIRRRMSSSSRVDWASAVSTSRRPGPRSRALSTSAAQITSALGSSRSSANASSASGSGSRMRSRSTSRLSERRGSRRRRWRWSPGSPARGRPRRRSCRAATRSTRPAPPAGRSPSRSPRASPTSPVQVRGEQRRSPTPATSQPVRQDQREHADPDAASQAAACSRGRSPAPEQRRLGRARARHADRPRATSRKTPPPTTAAERAAVRTRTIRPTGPGSRARSRGGPGRRGSWIGACAPAVPSGPQREDLAGRAPGRRRR